MRSGGGDLVLGKKKEARERVQICSAEERVRQRIEGTSAIRAACGCAGGNVFQAERSVGGAKVR